MYMSGSEIIGSYNRADNKREQLKILAELNSCETSEITKILEANGIVVKSKLLDLKPQYEKIKQLYDSGKNMQQIAEIYGVHRSRIYNLLWKNKAITKRK